MASLFWLTLTYGVLNLGLGVGFLTLSGVARLERAGASICGLTLTLGNSVSVRLPLVVALVGGIVMFSEHRALDRLRAVSIESAATSGSVSQQLKASVVRHQRNWWISLCSILVWLVVWRLSGVVTRYRQAIKELEKKLGPQKSTEARKIAQAQFHAERKAAAAPVQTPAKQKSA